MQTIQEIFLDMFRGDTQKFDVGPGALVGGFSALTDVVKFTAKRVLSGAPEIALVSPGDIAIQGTTNARVTIPPTATAALPFEIVEFHCGVEVVRASEKFTLASGIMIVRPVVRQ